MTALRSIGVAILCVLAAACAVGPNYKRPGFEAMAAYKEEAGWKPTEPADILNHGP